MARGLGAVNAPNPLWAITWIEPHFPKHEASKREPIMHVWATPTSDSCHEKARTTRPALSRTHLSFTSGFSQRSASMDGILLH